MLEGYYDVEEAAEKIGVTPGRVRQMLTSDPPRIRGKRLPEGAKRGVWMIPIKEVMRVAKIEQVTGRPRVGFAK